MVNNTKKSGRLVLKEIEFNSCVKRKVGKHNSSAGKITLPKDWIGEEVYVILVKEWEIKKEQ